MNPPPTPGPLDLARLVRRGEVFRRVRAVAVGSAVGDVALLAAYAGTGLAALVPLLCLVAVVGLGATYVASRLACAPLPRRAGGPAEHRGARVPPPHAHR